MQTVISILGRLCLVMIFLMSAVGNKIPNYNAVAGVMAKEGVPAPQILLGGAIVFLIVGGVSVLAGYKARFGAGLLLIFLGLATYYFHDFWNFPADEQQNQMIQFLKNVGLSGAMLMIIANGSGAGSLENYLARDAAAKARAPVAK